MTHKIPSRTKGLPMVSNISIDILYEIHPKYLLSAKYLRRPSQFCLIHSIYVSTALYSESSNIGLVVFDILQANR
jgi:hypothetical protein